MNCIFCDELVENTDGSGRQVCDFCKSRYDDLDGESLIDVLAELTYGRIEK